MKIILAYITCRDETEAIKIGKGLVENRLAACVNILDGMTSIFWWADKIEEFTETVLIAKTNEGSWDELEAFVKQNHSRICPCIIALRVVSGNQDYIDWLEENLQ